MIQGARTEFRGRERDVREVRNYWIALLRVEEWASARKPVSEVMIRRLHALVERGARSKPTPYRDSQNVIRDSASRSIVYMPPEAHDVPSLMAAMVRWIKEAGNKRVPVPLIAGLAHYQFVTIHPFLRRQWPDGSPARHIPAARRRLWHEWAFLPGGASRP